MASITLAPERGWAVGETITVYAVDARGVQTGSAVTTGTVGADSTTPLTGIPRGARYIATDGTRAVQFSIKSDASGMVKGVVVADEDGEYGERPPGFTSVEFIGANDPDTLAEDGDTWTPTA